jgi:hypothetical protein
LTGAAPGAILPTFLAKYAEICGPLEDDSLRSF